VTNRWTFRTRLVVAIVAVSLAVLGLSYLATYGLVRRALQNNAASDLQKRSAGLVELVESAPNLRRPGLLAALKITDLRAVGITPEGVVVAAGADTVGLPAPLTAADVVPSALLQGRTVSGRRGNTVYLAEPTPRFFGRARVVLVATDTVDMSVLRRLFPLLVIAGLFVLALASLAATWIARRLTRPIREIERAARQLATGDLAARADVPKSSDEELRALAETLNDMARQIGDARGTERAFLLSISHDLRTPLTSIRGYAEALGDGTLDDANPDDRKRAATVIGAEARRLERLVRDLLDLSRLDSHQFSLNRRPCDVSEIVEAAAVAFAPKAAELGVTLSVLPSPPLPADVDADRLAQIVANLVENALKYAHHGVEVYATHSKPSEFAIVVSDDGPGIASDKIDRVFERLYTVRETPGRAVGTGLGLAIVRELASAMGGRAWVDSTAATGSRFVVTLPTLVAEAAS
jgi:two-component system sensor histidine kinase BaeS